MILGVAGLGLALALGGCGFSPLYGRPAAGSLVATELGEIVTDPIPGRVGLRVRNNLIDLISPSGSPAAPQYRLAVRLKEEREGLLISGDASITRYNYTLFADYDLVDIATGDVIDRGKARAIAGYNVVESQFATLSAEKDAEARAARELAQEIRLRLGVGFERRARLAAGGT